MPNDNALYVGLVYSPFRKSGFCRNILRSREDFLDFYSLLISVYKVCGIARICVVKSTAFHIHFWRNFCFYR